MIFPDSGWDPGVEYFQGEGRYLLGSSALKSYIMEPAAYWETMKAQAVERFLREYGNGVVNAAARMLLSSAVDLSEGVSAEDLRRARETFEKMYSRFFNTSGISSYAARLLEGPSRSTTELGSALDHLLTGEAFDEFQDMAKKKQQEAHDMEIVVRVSPYGHYFDGVGKVAYQTCMRWCDPSGIDCRSKPDVLRVQGGFPMYPDLKVVSYRIRRDGAGQVRSNLRSMLLDTGADLQAALVRRGAKELWAIDDLDCMVLVVKGTLPYTVSLLRWSPETIAASDQQVDEALSRLAVENQHFLATGELPEAGTGEEL